MNKTLDVEPIETTNGILPTVMRILGHALVQSPISQYLQSKGVVTVDLSASAHSTASLGTETTLGIILLFFLHLLLFTAVLRIIGRILPSKRRTRL